jgi:nucleoside-diphosphate-sugar epimerase
MESDVHSEVVNLASQNPVALFDIIESMQKIAGYEIEVRVNPAFVRKNEIKSLCGSKAKLQDLISAEFRYTIEETLQSMYSA